MIPFSPLQLLNSYQGVVWASSGPRWRSVGGVHGAGGEKLGYIVWVGHGNRRSQRNRTSFVLLCKWPGFSHYLSTSARHQTIWSPGKLKLGSPLLPFFDHILSQEWTWGGSPEHGEMCTQQKHNDHRGRTGSVFSSVPQIQRSPFPDPCQHFLLKGWAPPKSLCKSPAGPAGGSSPRKVREDPSMCIVREAEMHDLPAPCVSWTCNWRREWESQSKSASLNNSLFFLGSE